MNTRSGEDLDLSDFSAQAGETIEQNNPDMKYYWAVNKLCDRLETTYDALKGIQMMLGWSLEELLGFEDGFAHGVDTLLCQQLENLDSIMGEARVVRSELHHAPQSESASVFEGFDDHLAEVIRTSVLQLADLPAWHDLDTIATRARVRKCDVARVMFVLTGEDHEGPAYRAWDGNLSEGVHSHLLSGLCWEAMSHGDMWGQVSTATGLDLEKVKEVLQAMLEYSPRRKQISLEPFADIKAAQAEDAAMRARVAEQDDDRPSAQSVARTLDHLRGANLAEIARSTNLNEDTIRRVLDRLLAYPAPDELPAVSNG